ncbi:MAG: hypothetical protein ACOX4J_01735 [Anaerovoracaceae bacterium]
MKRVHIQTGGVGLAECSHNGNKIRLLMSERNVEVIHMEILPDSILWMSPGDQDSTEYYYILEGKLLLLLDDREHSLGAG